MLGKCFKYELKSYARLLLPVFAVIVISGIGIIIFKESAFFVDLGLEVMSTMVFIPMLVIACVCGFIICFVQAPARYYSTMLSKEAYLVRTLPVQPYTYFLGIMLNAALWFILTAAISIAAVLGIPFTMRSLSELIEEINFLDILSAMIAFIYGQMLVILGLTFGSNIGKGKKLINALFIYLSFQVFGTISAIIPITGEHLYGDNWSNSNAYTYVMIGYRLAVIVAGFAFVSRCIKNNADVY